MISDNFQQPSLETTGAPMTWVLPNENQPAEPYEAAAKGRYANVVKPVVDRVAAALLLIPSSLVMLVVAFAVAVRIGRPIIFRQVRVGQHGQLFTVYKFRTMTGDRRNQDVRPGEERRVSHKREDDPRLTPLGRTLRRWSLDELPQLWNVVRGEMSIVGPRPELPSIVSHFAPWQHERHAVKPGLTGNWQVCARGSAQLMHERTDLDIDYVRSIGVWTDLKILLLTIPAVLGLRKGI